jgi:CheY-like chemotaxis protein
MSAAAVRQIALRQATVMVVDDDDDIRDTLTALLEEEGYTVSAHANGREALEALRTGERPCLIFLDLMMPVMDGLEFRALQLADPDLAYIPVVLVTAAVVNRGQLRQYVEVVPKPIKIERLLEILSRYH